MTKGLTLSGPDALGVIALASAAVALVRCAGPLPAPEEWPEEEAGLLRLLVHAEKVLAGMEPAMQASLEATAIAMVGCLEHGLDFDPALGGFQSAGATH